MLDSEGPGLLVFSPLAGGALTGKYRDPTVRGRRHIVPFPPIDQDRTQRVLAVLDVVGKRHGTTSASVALAWLLHQPRVTSVIIGVKRFAQLEENLASTRLQLSDQDLEELDAASALPVEYPAWMVAMAEGTRTHLLRTGEMPNPEVQS